MPDGRASAELKTAIGNFQESHGLPVTRRLDPSGAAVATLDRLLPAAWRGLRALDGTDVVYATTAAAGTAIAAARLLEERTLLPRPVAAGLSALAREVLRAHGLVLEADGHALDGEGRLVQRLRPSGVRWLSGDGRLVPTMPSEAATPVVDRLRRHSTGGDLEWVAGTLPAVMARALPPHRVAGSAEPTGPSSTAGTLAVRTRRRLRVLVGRPHQVDYARFSRYGLRPTGDPVADQMVDAALAAQDTGTAFADDLDFVVGALQGAFPEQAGVLSRLRAGETPGDLETALHLLESALASFGRTLITDHHAREEYLRRIARKSREYRELVASGARSAREVAEEAHRIRNDTLVEIRRMSTALGRNIAQRMKPEGRDFAGLVRKYTLERVGRSVPIESLAAADQRAIYETIIAKAGQDSVKVTETVRAYSRVGRGLVVLSIALAAYSVYTSDDPARQAVREAAVIGGGAAAGAMAGAAVGVLAGPGAPVAVGIGMFVGAVLGGLGVDLTLDELGF